MLDEVERATQHAEYVLAVAVLDLHVQVGDLVGEDALVLHRAVDDVRDAQVAHNAPVLGLVAAADVDLVLDDAVRIDDQISGIKN